MIGCDDERQREKLSTGPLKQKYVATLQRYNAAPATLVSTYKGGMPCATYVPPRVAFLMSKGTKGTTRLRHAPRNTVNMPEVEPGRPKVHIRSEPADGDSQVQRCQQDHST